MLGRIGCGLFFDALMCGHQVIRVHGFYLRMLKLIAKAPVVLSSHIPFSLPFVITPPHVSLRKKVFYFLGVVSQKFIGVIGIPVMGMIRIGRSIQIVIRIWIIKSWIRVGIVQQQRFIVPVKPEVFIVLLPINPVVEVLYHCYNWPVKSPEAELGHFISFCLHLLHGFKQNLPFVPVPDRIGYIHDQHIHTRVGQHGHILPDNIFILTEKVAHLRFTPMEAISIGSPQGMIGIQTCRGICLQDFCDIGREGTRETGVMALGMPGNIEDSDYSPFILL